MRRQGSARTFAFLAVLVALGFSSGCACKTKTCPVPKTPARPAAMPRPEAPRPPVKRVEVSRKQQAATDAEVAWARRTAEALLREQEYMAWQARTRGERTFYEDVFAGREALVSRKAMAMLEAYIEQLKGQPELKLALNFLLEFLATSYIDRRTASFEDELQAAEAQATVRLPWLKEPVAYRNLPALLSKEKDPKRRKVIRQAQAHVIRTKLNPILVRKYNKAHELAQWMGYPSYFALSERVRHVKVRPLLEAGWRFFQETDTLHRELLDQVARYSLGVPAARLTRADHLRLMRAPKLEKFLPARLMLPSFLEFLKGMGLDLTTASGTKILIDDALHPKKNPRAACFPLVVPSDIRISLKPTGGILSWTTLFHEGGHALHYAWTTEKQPEFKYLGSASATEAFAELFARVWAEPAWLEHYRKFLRARNKQRPKRADILKVLRTKPWFLTAEAMGMVMPARALRSRKVPVPTDRDLAWLIRHRLAWEMYLYRRYGWAKLVYEAALHGADPSVWKAVYQGPISDRKALYRKLFSQAYGYQLTDEDAERYLSDVDPFLYAADYARAFVAADMMLEYLRKKFGDTWFLNKEAGAFLKSLWAKGNRWTADELVRHLGYSGLDYEVTRARIERLLAAARKLAGEKARAKPRHKARRKPCGPRAKPGKGTFCPIPTK